MTTPWTVGDRIRYVGKPKGIMQDVDRIGVEGTIVYDVGWSWRYGVELDEPVTLNPGMGPPYERTGTTLRTGGSGWELIASN